MERLSRPADGAAGGRPRPRDRAGTRQRSAEDRRSAEEMAPCLRCGVPLPVRLMGCKGGHCPNCGHPYPHGDCSD